MFALVTNTHMLATLMVQQLVPVLLLAGEPQLPTELHASTSNEEQ